MLVLDGSRFCKSCGDLQWQVRHHHANDAEVPNLQVSARFVQRAFGTSHVAHSRRSVTSLSFGYLELSTDRSGFERQQRRPRPHRRASVGRAQLVLASRHRLCQVWVATTAHRHPNHGEQNRQEYELGGKGGKMKGREGNIRWPWVGRVRSRSRLQ
jgi:hypothetical protein